MELPSPKIIKHGKFKVLRDDLLSGGTKRRVLIKLFNRIEQNEIVYPSCQYGEGHLALAYAGKDSKKKITLFYPEYESFTTSFDKATKELKANYQFTKPNHSQIQVGKVAKEYSTKAGAFYMPIGFAIKEFEEELINIIKSLNFQPKEVWTIAGSGTLARALQSAWSGTVVNAVSLGLPQCNAGNANLYNAPEKPNEEASILPPYPSNRFYDAKLWRFAKKFGSTGALIWNVA